jgi:predicted RNA-binding protein YlqC (UPF0109 family)
LETAVRLQPDLWEGHLDLAMVLGRQGATAAAIRHLKIAAGGSDTETKTAAKELLRKLGQ